MATLFVMRHGKSDWSAGSSSDRERPLRARGERAARTMGRLLARLDQVPGLVLASPAERARRTAELVREQGGREHAVQLEPVLYEGSLEEVLALLRGLPAEVESVLLVGHEPTCSFLVAALTGARPPRFPTAALARIELDGRDWAELGRGVLTWLVTPRLLEAWDAGT